MRIFTPGALVVLLASSFPLAADPLWPQFRGPASNPVGTAERLGGAAPDLVSVPTFRPA